MQKRTRGKVLSIAIVLALLTAVIPGGLITQKAYAATPLPWGGLTIALTSGSGEPVEAVQPWYLGDPGDYYISSNRLVICSDTPMTISGTSTATLTITVPEALTANITLDNVNIQHSSLYEILRVQHGATLNLSLVGENTLKSYYDPVAVWGAGYGWGQGKLIIDGPGKLMVEAGAEFVAIGSSTLCGDIIINGGIVEAIGGIGIGDGDASTCGSITINGGVVNAKSIGDGPPGYAAAIRSGKAYNNAVLIINSGTVTAEGNGRVPGILGDVIIVNGGTVETYNGIIGDDITIVNGTVSATGGDYGIRATDKTYIFDGQVTASGNIAAFSGDVVLDAGDYYPYQFGTVYAGAIDYTYWTNTAPSDPGGVGTTYITSGGSPVGTPLVANDSAHKFVEINVDATTGVGLAIAGGTGGGANTTTVTANAGYGGTVTGGGGAGVYTVTPNSGFVIDQIFVDGAAVSTPNRSTYTVAIPNDGKAHSIFATFGYTVNFNTPANGTLTVSSASVDLSSGSIVRGGQVLDITAAPASSYVLSKLEVNGEDVTASYSGGYSFTVGSSGDKRTLTNGASAEVLSSGAEIVATFALNGAVDATPPTPGVSGAITTASVAQTSLTLNWTLATDDTSDPENLVYYVYRSASGNIGTVANCEANGTLLNTGGTVDIATYPVTGLTAGTTYYFNVVVEDEAGNKAAYTMKSETTIAGTMTITISGQDVAIIPDDDTPLGDYTHFDNPFVDVKESDWFYDDVIFTYTHGLMVGTSADPMMFSPNNEMTRGMIVTVLYRMAGEPSANGLPNPFTDVRNDTWYTDAVKWAEASNIVEGVGGARFAPDTPITRQDLAVILYRYDVFMGLTLPAARDYTGFNDSGDISDYAKAAVEAFYCAGIIEGKPGAIFDPKGTATRAEVAAMLHRLLQLAERNSDSDSDKVVADVVNPFLARGFRQWVKVCPPR